MILDILHVKKENSEQLNFLLSVEAISSKVKHYFTVIWSADKASITLSNSGDLGKDSEEQETTAYFCVHF